MHGVSLSPIVRIHCDNNGDDYDVAVVMMNLDDDDTDTFFGGKGDNAVKGDDKCGNVTM